MKINMSFQEFIESFDENFPGFILRVRKGSHKSEVYYNGIEAFEVKRNAKDIELNFPINVYKLNPTGLKNASKNNKEEEMLVDEKIEEFEGSTIKRKEANYCKDVGEVLDAMHKLFDFEMSEITFDINFKENMNKIINKFYSSIIRDFTKSIKRHHRDKKNLNNSPVFKITNKFNAEIIDSNLSKTEVEQIFRQFSGKVHFVLQFCPKLTTKDEEKNSTPKDIIKLQCWFLRYARDIGAVSGVQFVVHSDYKYKGNAKNSLKTFSDNTKNAIEKYKFTTGKKLEKSYQHFFMLRAHEMKDLFDMKTGEYVDYFEQEYGIYNPNIYGSDKIKKKEGQYKTGRIDCIVYKYKFNNHIRFITDIYMVELKVNCDVILGNNGVMTHLEDIKEFLKFSDQGKYKDYDYKTLETRICDRIKILSNEKEEARFENVKKHFYTIIGYTRETEKNLIQDMLKSLTSIDGVHKMIQNGISRKVNGKSNHFKLNKRFEGTTLYDFCKQTQEICDIKFFLERIPFDEKDIGIDFDDITEEIF